MLFSSPVFFLFFGIYLLLHRIAPLRWRLGLIIIGSTFFYGYFNPYYVWIPFPTMIIAYYGAIWMMGSADQTNKRRRLIVVVMALLLPLLIFKYTNFIYQDVLGLVVGFQGRLVDWPLPLGISFVTFTLIAYVVEVYSGHYRLERNAAMLAGLVLFFPHLAAGPILRPSELLPQLHRPKRRISALAVFGFTMFSVGLLKKTVIADSLSEVTVRVFSPMALNITGADYLLGIYGFAVQIYCDFSGYTDMAIGSALLLGVRLPSNFQRPYVSSSVVEFWTRWHITLSRWLRDYLYIPLGGNRLGVWRQIVNMFITMALGGLWHGASWTFVMWGLAHGAGISFNHMVRRVTLFSWLGRVPHSLKVFATFHFVAASWILFRSPDISVAWRVVSGPFLAPWNAMSTFALQQAFPLTLVALFFVTHAWDDHQNIRYFVQRAPKALLWPMILLIWALVITVSQGISAKFIYFDF